MLRCQNDHWGKALSATSNQLNAVQLLSDPLGWAVGNNGTILKFNCSNWQYTGNPVNKNLNDLAMHSATNGWAVGDRVTLLQFDGANWNTVTSSTIGDITAISMSDSSFGWAGISSSLLNFHAGSWQWVGYGSPNISPYAMKTLDRNHAWAVGESASDSPIIHYAGDVWNFYASPTYQTLYGLSFPLASRGWAVGENVILQYHGPDMDQHLFLPPVSK